MVCRRLNADLNPAPQVFPTMHHLGIVMEYASGGDLSELIDDRSQQGVRALFLTAPFWHFEVTRTMLSVAPVERIRQGTLLANVSPILRRRQAAPGQSTAPGCAVH